MPSSTEKMSGAQSSPGFSYGPSITQGAPPFLPASSPGAGAFSSFSDSATDTSMVT